MLHGVLNIYKEKGFTSHDVVAKLRGMTAQRKIGHTGTLDPDACGVLPVCLGNATKICDQIMDWEKTYETILHLGVVTDTQDHTGTVLASCDTSHLSDESVRDAVLSFIGEYDQVPPMYSAKKVGGKKLYELARSGVTIERKPRKVTIRNIEILSVDLPLVEMRITCSKGTYIRTLCNDIGEKLGVGGCMERLIRTKVGPFMAENAMTLSELSAGSENEGYEKFLVHVDELFPDLPSLVVSQDSEQLLFNGNPMPCEAFDSDVTATDGQVYRIYDQRKRFTALYRYREQQRLFRPEKMFLPED